MNPRMRLLLPQITFSPPDDGGASPSIGAPPPPKDTQHSKNWESPKNESGETASQKKAASKPAQESSRQEPAPEPTPSKSNDGDSPASIRDSIKEASRELNKSRDGKQKTLPYFDEEEPETPEPTNDTPEAPEAQQTEPEQGSDDPAETKGEGEAPIGEGEEPETYYDPQQHAPDPDKVYPNSYKSRKDAEFAIANKLKMYKEKADSLEEVGSEVGSTIPFDVQEKIDQYSDVTSLAEAQDDEVREFIVDLDQSLKTIDDKYDKVSRKHKVSQNLQEAEKTYKEKQKPARDAFEQLELNARVNDIPADASLDDLLSVADEQIEAIIEPIDTQIAEHENDSQFIKDKGQAAYVKKLRQLENQKREKLSELKEARQKIVDWNDARVRLSKAKENQPKNLSTAQERAQQAKAIEESFTGWADDRSVGAYKLDIFEANTADPVAHLKSFALAPKNRDKFDLTTKKGWDQMYNHWKSEMETRWEKSKANNTGPTGTKKMESKKTNEPIPEPTRNPNDPSGRANPRREMDNIRESIKKNSKAAFG